MKQTTTKRRVLASFLSLALCVSMLVGSTYAWFTDTVTSSGNIIKSGTLDVGMLWADGKEDPESDTTTWNDVEDDTNPPKPIFGYELWEPGYVQVRHIQVVNKGSLALKYNLTILANGEVDAVADLAEVIDVYTKTPAVQVTSRESVPTVLNRVGTLREVLNDTTVLAAATQGHLSAGDKSAIITIALKMQEGAGNKYQNKQVNAGFDVKLFATQWTEEEDTFDEQYDSMATYDSTNVTNDLHLSKNGATVTVPAGSANVNDVFELVVTNNGNSTDTDGKTTASFDIKLSKNGTELSSADINDTEYTVEIYVGKNLDVIGVYHNGVPVLGYTYDLATGIVTFKTKSFSPFTVEFHAPKQITFDSNTGSGTMEKQNVYAGVETQLANNAFTKTGYSFAGWATSADGAVVYNDGESVTFTEGTTLYAKWNANPYEVSFNAQGGTGNMANQIINYDQTANLTAVGFTKDGYNFVGWATEENGAKVYDDGASYTMQSTTTVTLYAVWSAIDYDVVFNANGGTGNMAKQTITFDDTAKLTKNTFTKTGYTFAGWSTTSNGYATIADEADYTMATVGGVTLYATWTANNYDVVFNANGGSGTMANQSIAYDSKANLNANAFEKTGYSFEGWATTPDGEAEYTDGEEYTMETVGGVTLYAQWEADDYTVAFSPNGGTGNLVTQIITFNETVNLRANTFTRTGYTFAGWSTTSNGNVEYADGAEYTMTTESVTLYAVWTEIKPNSIVIKKDGDASWTKFTDVETPIQLTATVAPNTAFDTSVTWTSSDEDVATVDENGIVTPIRIGSTTIRATCNANTDVYSTCKVVVLVSVPYLEYNTSTGTFVNKTAYALPITADMTTLNSNSISNGWYAVTENVTINSITTNGTVNLILCDNKQLTVNNGISNQNTLNIYAQSDGNNKGILTATKNGKGAAIGGGDVTPIKGNITIHGGNITATNSNTEPYPSNIGMGGNITIHGGEVTANGGEHAAGIGNGTVTINGGTVTATGGDLGAGIGGGYYESGGTVTINGGTVTAIGGTDVWGEKYSGIGAGAHGSSHGTLTVADGLTVFGGNSANPTTVIGAPYTSRPQYMVVKPNMVVKPINKLTVSGEYFDFVAGDFVQYSVDIEYYDDDTWGDLVARNDRVYTEDYVDAPDGKIVKISGLGEYSGEVKNRESTHNYELVSVNDKVNQYTLREYYLQD